MAAPSSFHLFTQLPMELRLKIYHLALTPRTVPVRLRLDLDAWNWSTEKDWWTTYAVVPDKEFPSSPMPSVLGSCYEARRELSGLYGCLEIERSILESLLGPGSGKLHPSDDDDGAETEADQVDKSSSTKKLLESLLSGSQGRRRPRFNPDRDILAWREPRRWACCGDAQLRTLVHPLFLAASLSVRRVSVEYVPCMADLLEVLAFGVLDGSGGRLDALDVRVQNPSDCRVLRFRLCRVPETTRFSSPGEGERGVVGRVIDDGDRPEDIEELVRRHGLVWFPWARGEAYRNQEKREIEGDASGREDDPREPLVRSILDRILIRAAKPSSESAPAAPTDSPLSAFLPSANLLTRNVAVLQVLADPTTGPGASGSWARIRHLREDPARVQVRYPHVETQTLSFGAGDLRLDVLLWCHMLKLHGAGYPANLPFDIVGVPCHGFCGEEVGMGG
ncbi:hypothetical protein LQW54_004783 [Pestalotiopsis sp. IQ-011]